MRRGLKLVLLLSIMVFSCEDDSQAPIIEESNPLEEIIGMYDGQRNVWYVYFEGSTYGPQTSDRVLEIRTNDDDENYSFLVDGYWTATLIFDRLYDDILYCTVSEGSCYWENSDNGTLVDIDGHYSTLSDYTASEVTFIMNNNNKLEVCVRYYNIRDALTEEPDNYWAIVYWEGYR